MPSPLLTRLRIKLPQLHDPSSTATPIAIARRAPPTVAEARAALPLLLLKPSGGTSFASPEEGRLHIILSAVQQATGNARGDPSPLGIGQRQQLRQDIEARLTGLLNDARIGRQEQAFLRRLSERLASAVLDGNYQALLGGGGPRDTLTTAILKPQSLPTTTTLRNWTIGVLDQKSLGSGARALLRQTVSVHRGSALLAEGLSFAAGRAEQLGDATAPAVLARRVAMARLSAAVMQSGMSAAPFLIDLDREIRLSRQDDAAAVGHLGALNDLWGRLLTMSRLNVIGPLVLLSHSPADPTVWENVWPGVYATQEEALIRRSVPYPSPSDAPAPVMTPSESVPLPLLHALTPDLEQVLDRAAGLVSLVGVEGPAAPSFQLRLPGLVSSAEADGVLAQDRQLALADAFCVALFADSMPFLHERLPRAATLTEDEFRVGNALVVKRVGADDWRFDPEVTAVVRHIFSPSSFERPRLPDLPAWDATTGTYSSVLPPDTAPNASSPLVRVLVQMENDKNMHSVGATLSRAHPDELVWLRLHPAQGFAVVRGQSLLRNATSETRIQLLVNGHGHTSWTTKGRLLSGRTANELARELTRLMTDLRSAEHPLSAVESITLLSCALETPAADRSFGREFAAAASAYSLVRPGAEITIYADTLLLDFGKTRMREGTRAHPGAPAVRRAAGTTWIFRLDPDTRTVQVRDKFPHGGDGVLADNACCVVLGGTGGRRASRRSVALARSLILDQLLLNTRFREVIGRHRPAGWALLPHLREIHDGSVLLTYINLENGETSMRSVTAPADRQVLRAGTALIEQGLVDVQTLVASPPVPGGGIDLLNLGLLALALTNMAQGSNDGDRYQQALWYLGVMQGGFRVGADVAEMVTTVSTAMREATGTELANVVRQSATLSHALASVSNLAQIAEVGLDLQQLIQSLSDGTSSQVTAAALRFGLDSAGMTLAGLAAVADLLDLALLAIAAEGLAVPLTGLSIGIIALNQEVQGATTRISRNLRPLHEINKGYDEPLRRVPAGPDHPQEVLLVNGWSPLKRIDFRANEVSFADGTIGATALHPSQLYWQAGSRRLHDWWISDGNDRQGRYVRHGLELDLWTLMRSGRREAIPRTALAPALRDPDLVLALMTAPAFAIHHEGYSSSRAGGDFSLTHDALIEWMQISSDARFVADYVTSSSMAKSADLWRYDARPTLLEVVLDEQTRVMALPGRADVDADKFVFDDSTRRSIQPFDQSKVSVRLIGGGGHYTLALPPDGTVRNRVRILPSAHGRDVWTVMLKGGLARGGQTLDFLGGDQTGFRLAGQEIQFEALNHAIVQVADPAVPGVRLLLDLENRDAAFMLTLPTWSDTLDPMTALAQAIQLVSATDGTGHLFEQANPGDIRALVRLSSSLDGVEALSGLLDPHTGGSVLHSKRHLMMRGPDTLGWKQYELRGGQVSLDEDGRPVVRYDGGHYLQPVAYSFWKEVGGFVRDPVVLTAAGEGAVLRWIRQHPVWTPAQLTAFLTMELAAGIELTGPDGRSASPVTAIDFSDGIATSRRPSGGASFLALWARLDRVSQLKPGAAKVRLDSDPGLARALAVAGVSLFAALPANVMEVAATDVALAMQWLVLGHAQASFINGGPPMDLLPPSPRLNPSQRNALVDLFNELRHLLERHQAGGDHGSDWIKLGTTPEASSSMAYRLRDAGVNIQIDALSRDRELRVTDRAGPDDHYDVKVPSLKAFMDDLTDQLDVDARAARPLMTTSPSRPAASPLQQALADWAARADTVRQGGRMGGLPPALAERIQVAGLTVSEPGSPSHGSAGAPTPQATAAAAELGQIVSTADGQEVDGATFRLWQAQAALQGLALDDWYARHAVPGSPMEINLREAAITALCDRLVRMRDAMDRSGLMQGPLADDMLLNRLLFTALQRLMPDAASFKIAYRDTGRPGDLFEVDDDAGDSHYVLMLRPDTGFFHLNPSYLPLGANPYWAYVGRADELSATLRPRLESMPGLTAFDPSSYHAWQADDPEPVAGGVYVASAPSDGAYRLFRLKQIGQKAYGPLPAGKRSNAEWLFLGTSLSLGTSELGALAARGIPLQSQTFSRGLVEWWLRQLSPAWSDEGYVSFSLDATSFEARTQGGTTFQLDEDGSLVIRLDDTDITTFRLRDDPELTTLKRQFLAGRAAVPLVLIQTNGRPVDLDGVGMLGATEVILLEESDGAPRRIDLDDTGTASDEIFYEGSDLLIHRTGDGRLIRIREALTAATQDPIDNEWGPDPETTITGGGGKHGLVWPDRSRTLRLPMLDVHASALEVARDATDLVVSDAMGWDSMRLIDVDALASDAPVALLRYRNEEEDWRRVALPASLAALMAEDTDGSIARWSLLPEHRGSGGATVLERRPSSDVDSGTEEGGSPAPSTVPLTYWPLKSIAFSEAMASFPPSTQGGLGITWRTLPPPPQHLTSLNTGTIVA